MGIRAAAQRWIDRIDNLAARPGDAPDERLLKTLLLFLGVFALLAGAVCVGWFHALRLPVAAATAGLDTLAVAAAFAHFLIRKDRRLLQFLLLAAALGVPFGVQLQLGGFAASGAVSLWALLAPLMALLFYGVRASVYWFAAFLLLALGSGLVGGTGAALWYTENLLLFSCLVYILLRYFVGERARMRAALEREQEKSEQLLLNILPGPIAARLKEDPQAVVDAFAEVTVVFADIVGFTAWSARTPAPEVVRLLNELFSRFDALSGRLGVEKIKTIGDAYMACAGLPVERPDHAVVAAELALGMREAVAAFRQEQGIALDVRIGLNSGPVVAGVIGLKKFIYDLWGDTVNTASRMESHGLPGAIQVSASTHALLQERYVLEPRGPIAVKGKGTVETWFLTGRR
ncbi:MAG TPA: adenylate/guanylate cyclase domain-containing protein [Gammaproteobacteria bacterium]|nr:adenylate/guanylate cyclase domain-containing protein [Gammaproteobacteria bacterium]